ncbi:MAG: trypsin-like peptidase domain-containing protein [Candidatus Krumholzibacteriia bacterium]|nr:trypsin-like peptidase domain-containing protein [bacterium]
MLDGGGRPRARGGRWVPVLTGLLTGLSIAALAVVLFLVVKAPTLLRREAQDLLLQQLASLRLEMGDEGFARAAAGTDGVEDSRRSAIVAATEKVAPAVVSVQVTQVQKYVAQPRSIFEYFEFFGRPRVYEQEVPGQGSGVLVSPFGRVVTNNHVVNGAKRIRVTLSDGRSFPAELLDTSTKHDIALLQLQLPKDLQLPYAELGDSDDLLLGEWVIAIGSPFGFQLNDIRPSVTVGVVSALHREVSAGGEGLYSDMIQTDAAINPGNSGGPLVDSQGKVVGINTLIFTKDGGSLGIGFARPINKVVWILNEFEKFGSVRDTWAGFEGTDLKPFHVVHYGLNVRSGIFVTTVFRGGPAEDAGLRPGDVVTAIGGSAVANLADGNRIFARYEVGDKVKLTVYREGKSLDLTVTLESYKDADVPQDATPPGSG